MSVTEIEPLSEKEAHGIKWMPQKNNEEKEKLGLLFDQVLGFSLIAESNVVKIIINNGSGHQSSLKSKDEALTFIRLFREYLGTQKYIISSSVDHIEGEGDVYLNIRVLKK